MQRWIVQTDSTGCPVQDVEYNESVEAPEYGAQPVGLHGEAVGRRVEAPGWCGGITPTMNSVAAALASSRAII